MEPMRNPGKTVVVVQRAEDEVLVPVSELGRLVRDSRNQSQLR